MSEVIRPPIAPPVTVEGRRRIIIASCTNCNWYSSLPTTDSRLIKDSDLLQDTAKQHEEKYNHLVNFKVK